MIERDRLQPVDTDVYMIRIIVTARQLQVFTTWSAAADEHCVPAFGKHRLEALDRRVEAHFDSHVDDHRDLFIEYARRKTEGGDVAAHEAASFVEPLEDRHIIPKRHEVIRDSQ